MHRASSAGAYPWRACIGKVVQAIYSSIDAAWMHTRCILAGGEKSATLDFAALPRSCRAAAALCPACVWVAPPLAGAGWLAVCPSPPPCEMLRTATPTTDFDLVHPIPSPSSHLSLPRHHSSRRRCSPRPSPALLRGPRLRLPRPLARCALLLDSSAYSARPDWPTRELALLLRSTNPTPSPFHPTKRCRQLTT